MTSNQKRLYWRHWGIARKALIASGLESPEADAQRKRLHALAMAPSSSLDFENEDLDNVLDEFAAAAGLPRTHKDGSRRRRLLWAIETYSPSPAYAAAICRDKFGGAEPSSLGADDLLDLLRTVKTRLAYRPTRGSGSRGDSDVG